MFKKTNQLIIGRSCVSSYVIPEEKLHVHASAGLESCRSRVHILYVITPLRQKLYSHTYVPRCRLRSGDVVDMAGYSAVNISMLERSAILAYICRGFSVLLFVAMQK